MVIFCREPDCSQFVTQKDVWDAQKDMAYAVVGAVITLLLHRYLSKEGRKNAEHQ